MAIPRTRIVNVGYLLQIRCALYRTGADKPQEGKYLIHDAATIGIGSQLAELCYSETNFRTLVVIIICPQVILVVLTVMET